MDKDLKNKLEGLEVKIWKDSVLRTLQVFKVLTLFKETETGGHK